LKILRKNVSLTPLKVRVCRHFSNPSSPPRDPYIINEWPLIPAVSRINEITRIENYLFKIHCNIVFPRLDFPRAFLPEGLILKLNLSFT
jgi:hypothetical protein